MDARLSRPVCVRCRSASCTDSSRAAVTSCVCWRSTPIPARLSPGQLGPFSRGIYDLPLSAAQRCSAVSYRSIALHYLSSFRDVFTCNEVRFQQYFITFPHGLQYTSTFHLIGLIYGEITLIIQFIYDRPIYTDTDIQILYLLSILRLRSRITWQNEKKF